MTGKVSVNRSITSAGPVTWPAHRRREGQPAEDARDEENGDMSEPENPPEFWENIILDWITKNAGVRKERINKTRRFTDEPVNLTVVKVLNMMDDLVKIYNNTYNANLVLSQNWRLTHRVDKIGDFIAAFLEVVTSEEIGRVKKTGIA
jgi:rubredoxin